MVLKIGLSVTIVAVVLIAATSVMADAASCGDVPFPPALPNPSAFVNLPPRDAEIARHQAFEDVINWQKGLKTYRDCLNTLIDDDNRKITDDQNSGNKDDLAEITGLRSDVSKINSLFNSTVDTERNIVSNYNSVLKTYCGRKDVDLSICQRTQ